MATEATVGGPVDVSVNEPSLNQTTATESDFQNVDRLNSATNGSADEIENKQVADIADETVNSPEGSVSGASDTDALKEDLAKLSCDKGHARSSSAVKKPQSFNSVSRPESAAGSASTTPQPTGSSSASRLKLVAKSGSNLGGASKTLGVNGKPSGAPDPNLVWNRNRAPTQPEAKKRSDEELKHDGIHLADRLGPEDLKGQSNWADIDDDDEWAPDTITWTDGTKITLPPTEEPAASPVIQPAIIDRVKKEPILIPKSKSPVPISSASGSPSIKHSVLASGKGLVFKGAPEKPTLVAKPPAPPGPVKSPWAPLPPVEKVSPVLAEAPSQAPPTRYPLRDPSNSKSATPPPPGPTKEIATDDFSRIYRDGQMNPSRELYNSQSGRRLYYSVKSITNSKAPRNPQPPFKRAEIVGGSGHLAQRIGGKPHDMPPPPELGMNQGQVPPPRAGSTFGTPESLVSSQTFTSANNLNDRAHPPPPHQSLVSPHQAHAVPYQNAYNQDQPQADPNWEKAQKEYMKKRREEAVRRRMEEEAREEAAKQARIAEKLKALGPAPERKSAKKDTPSVVQRTDIPAALTVRSKAPSETKTSSDPLPTVVSSAEAKVEKATVTDPTPNKLAEPDIRAANGSTNPPMDYDKPRISSSQAVAASRTFPNMDQ
ncbi:hypothetical protein ONZ43_g3671 [Nemania bipapillata]|uniref:Uncharacterized protein n=1 Tax=Nemania bipapillata TaxID=110536 RepID=A0ACC2IVW0_9PEZI|nr:hypothetical protein ONZ43_g3671 [Nemania bipapillata]